MSKSRPNVDTYVKEYDTKIIQLAKAGKFLYEIAAEFDTTHKTMLIWRQRYESFAIAYAKALDIVKANLQRELFNMRHERTKNPRCVEFLLEQMEGQRQYSTVHVPGIADKNINKKIESLYNAVDAGDARPDQIKLLVESIKTSQDVQSGQETINKIKEMLKAGKTKELLELLDNVC
jgi:hypothetical protein